MNFNLRLKTLYRFWNFRLRSEKESVQYLLSRDLEGSTALDIGANKGVYTYWLSKKVGKKGQVFSFEPQPELGDFLEESKKAFGLNNVTIVNKGLSSKASAMKLYRRKVGDGAAMIATENNKLFDPTGKEEVNVQVDRLDDFIAKHDIEKLSFIKCDVEGHELDVFKGGLETLKKHKPTLLFECHHEEVKEGEVFGLLESIGYEGFFFNADKKVPAKEFESVPYPRTDNHRNYVFVAKN